MDQTVDPCTDFFSYSCGTWYTNTPLHANQSTTDATYTVIEAAAYKLVEKLVDAKLPKLTEFYDACMDTATLDTLGLAPIEDYLKAIRSANTTVEAIFRGVAISRAIGVQLFVKLSVLADTVDVTRNVLYADLSGFPFGRHKPLWSTVEQPYREYIATIFTLTSHAKAEVEAATEVVITFVRHVYLSYPQHQAAVTPRRLPLSAAHALYPLGIGLRLEGLGFDILEGTARPRSL
ncbi:hypothetical protein B5M09_007609 [Aphanomyces astaci]|uniref:Peptidase M13 N-terminal domain-containing protein n=1 Tax=Aphanomyces astaci TaxID=112090 RepID=A0A425DLU1_APHAT|nr:hypothetical protein B5M09_007609 [Aphanomyces astaci]